MIAHVLTTRTRVRALARSLMLVLALLLSLVAVAVVFSETAAAELDTFTTGDGHEGAVTVSANSVLNYSAPLNAAVSSGASTLTTGVGQSGANGTAAQAQFEANRLALVIQSSNYTGLATSGSQANIGLSSNSVGGWELARISSVSGSIAAGMTINFTSPLVNSYTGTGAQIVAVPEFTTVQVNNNRSWSANPWNGSSGGITAFLASGAVNLNNASSSINANGDGFRGGLLYNGAATNCNQLDGPVGGGKGEGIVSGVFPGSASSYASRGNIANGGGGGVCENSGGGGGGNGGQGGIGGQSYDGSRNVGGLGGQKLNYSAFDQAIFGGGGGAGDENNSNGGAGGNGGGMVFVRANSLTGSGTITADGNSGANSANISSGDAAGGGGAGGVVYARFSTTATCEGISVHGGSGGNEQSTGGVHGPGGGGAGGRIALQSTGGSCPASVSNGVAGTATATGSPRGAGPVSSNDATASGAIETVSGGGGISIPTAAVSSPANNAYTNDTTPTISGTSSMNAGTIRVSIDGVYVGSTTTAADGTWSFAVVSALSAGARTYTVRPVHYGLAGAATSSRTLNIDTTAPAAPTVSSDRTGSVAQTTATVSYTAVENGGTIQCSLDGGAYATCGASPVALSALAEGNHSYSVRQVDAAGNIGSVSSVAWVVDLTSPDAPAIVSPAGSPHYSPTASPDFSGTAEADSTVKLYDGATPVGSTTADANGNWSVTSATLTDGSHSVTATATDLAGNIGSDSASTSIVVDTTFPTIAITSPATGSFFNTGSVSVDFSVTDLNLAGGSSCKIDGGEFVNCASGYTSPSLAAGSHTITVEHTDLAGNVGSSSTTFTVDGSPPIVAISSPTANQRVSTSAVSISFSVSDANPSANSSCSVDGGAATSCSSPFQTNPLSDGSHTATISNTDAAGNTGSAAVTFFVDTQSPGAPTITAAPAGLVANSSAAFSFVGAEAGGSFECSLDGAAFASCTSPAQYLGLSDGEHDFRVRQVDAATNVGAIASRGWTVDTTPPAAPTVIGPSAYTNSPESSVSFAGSPDTVQLRCSFNGGAFSSCRTSPVSLGTLPDGYYTFTVEATDAAGNSSNRTISWGVDTVAPLAPTITSGPVGSVPSPDAQFAFTGSEIGGSFRCSLGAQPAASCNTPFEINGLSDGTYTFRVRQIDPAGNAGPTASRTWTVDTTPPPAPSVTGPSSPSGQTSALISFASSEPGATYTCSVDGGAYAACSSALSLTGLADGPHSVDVRAYDSAGNASALGSFNWSVDQTIYTADISGAPSGAVNTTDASLTFSASLAGSTFRCSLDGAPFTSCSSPASISGLAEGTHVFKLRASNGAQDAPEVTRSWTIDLTRPSVTITAPLAGSTTGSDTSISFTASDLHAPINTTCKLDSAAAAPCTSPRAFANLSGGNHTVVVVARDAAGNSGSSAVTWQVDGAAPAAPQITQPAADGATTDTTPTISGSAEPNSTVKLYADATLMATIPVVSDGAWTWTPSSPLAEGTYNFRATATDAYNNVSASSSIRALTVDILAPSAPVVTEPSAGPLNDSTPVVKGTAEPGTTVTVLIDGNAVSGGAAVDSDGNWQKLVSPALSDGLHLIAARATDTAGTNSPDGSSIAITVDTVPPSVSVTSPAAGAELNSTSLNVIFTTDPGASTSCKLDSGPFASCGSPLALSGLSEGSHSIHVEATDSAGNVAASIVTVTVDLTVPTAQITGGPTAGGDSNSNTPAFSFTNSEPGTFECAIDDAPFILCSSPSTLPSLGDGPHVFAVHAVDQAGNVSPDVTHSWTVDTAAPGAPSIDAPTDGAVTPDGTPTFTGNAGSADANSTLGVYVDGTLSGSTNVAPDGSWSYTLSSSLSDNSYAFTARATDAAGNNSPFSSAVHVRVDGANPSVQITTRPDVLTNDSTPTFGFSADEPATFECKIDSAAFATCASPFTSTVIADGPHQFFVRANDASGNVSGSAEWDWTSDTGGPGPQTCSVSGGESGIPANVNLVSAVAMKNLVKFTTSSDQFILIRISIYRGKKLVGTAVRANNAGNRVVAISTEEALRRNEKFTVRLSAITMSGGKSVAGVSMATDKQGNATLAGAPILSTVDCAPEKGAKKIRVKIARAVKVNPSSKKVTATVRASDWSVANVRIIQGGTAIGQKVFVFEPNRKLSATVEPFPGKKLVKGKALIQVATCSVDGVWQLFKKPFTVK